MRASFAKAISAPFKRQSGRHKTRSSSASIHPIVEKLEDRQFLSTYYVNSSLGSDSKSGTSTTAPWKTITRVNSQKLKAGDKILFQGGQSFSGSLYVPSAEGGTSTNPVIFSTYGTGRATINSGTKAGIDVAQIAGIAITNLNFNGSGMSSNSTAGIYFHIDFTNKKLSNVHIRNVEVKNYGREGILFKVNGAGGSSLSNVKIEDANIHDNKYGGIKATANKHNVNKNWIIQNVKTYNSPGSRSAGGVTGSGIFLADVDGATIQRCISYNNGKDGAAPVGIWAAGSNRVTMQYNESYSNHTATTSDGGGFDFDWDTHNSIMQYNYSHGNDGPGYLLGGGSHANSGNIIRYNISENDGRKNGRAGIQLWGSVTNASIHNNTIYLPSTGNSNSAAFWAHDLGSSGKVATNVQVRNNIFYTTGGVKVVSLTSGVVTKGSVKFNGNAYYSGGAAFKVQWGTSGYTSLSAWQSAKGQEKLNGISTGYQGDPKLVAPGKGGTIGNANNLSKLTAYKLQSTSPVINKGQTPTSFLSSVVKLDFFGDTALKGGKYDIGVDEVM